MARGVGASRKSIIVLFVQYLNHPTVVVRAAGMSTQSTNETPSAQPSNSSPGKPGGTNNTGNLYLCVVNSIELNFLTPYPITTSITFLATLFLLLFISCAIVLRSYILRRRFQQQLDEAMAAGILLAPRSPGSRKRRFGSKPKFHDAWLVQGGEKWEQMMVRVSLQRS